ncbi:hypothetical protein [Paenibacillus sinopodophylli]|uniref:hypothetical protein n=1 Tax=Paenibacillus sinopodophylli TaxID=1837342 RepID=UPI00110C9DA8|nr:hypothetical protein [Paenibacillus sinopodophylli]
MAKYLIGWRMIIELGYDRDDIWMECSQEWENVLSDARAEFDKTYLVGPLEYKPPKCINIHAIYSEGIPEHIHCWDSKESVGQ